MQRLIERTVVENVDGVRSNVIHYIGTRKRDFSDRFAIEISQENDEDLLNRLINYLFRVSYDSELEEGWHQPGRIGGNHRDRYLGEIFADKLLGCMGEMGLYKYIRDNFDEEVNEPNLIDPGGYENSDRRDLLWLDKNISIKTTRNTHNLLLLQKHHFREDGGYIPNIRRGIEPEFFDYHVLARLKAVNENINDVLNCIRFNRETITGEERIFLRNTIMETRWLVDIPGFITNEEFVEEVIGGDLLVRASEENQKYCFGRGGYNSVNKVDVENYYVQAIDLNPISRLKEITRKEGRVRYADLDRHFAYLLDDNENEYLVAERTFERTDSFQRIFDISEGLRLSFTVVKKNNKMYANDIREA